MIYTVTLNPCLDYIMKTENLTLGETNRSGKQEIYPGGKGINVSIVLKNLGIDTKALGFVAGFTGEEIVKRVHEMGVETDFITLNGGMSRINVKIKDNEETEINASGPVVTEQDFARLIEKLDGFLAIRRRNAELLTELLSDLKEYLILPKINDGVKPSWFGYLISVKEDAPFTKQQMVKYLEQNNIGTRQLFAGNILRQPMIVDNDVCLRIGASSLIRSKDLKEEYYQALPNTEFIMNNTFWVGTFPALGEMEISRIANAIHQFIKGYK